MAEPKKNMLGSILKEARIIGEKDILRALSEQKKSGLKFGEALIKLGVVSDEDVEWGLANQLDLPFIHLNPENIDPEAVRFVPQAVARRYNIVPYLLLENELTVVIDDPLNETNLMKLSDELGVRINVCLGLTKEILSTLDALYGSAESVWPPRTTDLTTEYLSDRTIKNIVGDVSGKSLLEKILELADQRQAASILLEYENERAFIRFRAEPRQTTVLEMTRGWGRIFDSVLRSSMQAIYVTPTAAEGFIDHKKGRRKTTYHVSSLQTAVGPLICLTLISPPVFGSSLESLKTDPSDKRLLKELLKTRSGEPGGLLVVTGVDIVRVRALVARISSFVDLRQTGFIGLGASGWFAAASDNCRHVEVTRPEQAGPLLELIGRQDNGPVALEDFSAELVRPALKTALGKTTVVAAAAFPDACSCLNFIIETAGGTSLIASGLRAIIAVRSWPKIDRNKATKKILSAKEARFLGLPEDSPIYDKPLKEPASEQLVLEILPVSEELEKRLDWGLTAAEWRTDLIASGWSSFEQKAKRQVLRGQMALDDFIAAFK